MTDTGVLHWLGLLITSAQSISLKDWMLFLTVMAVQQSIIEWLVNGSHGNKE